MRIVCAFISATNIIYIFHNYKDLFLNFISTCQKYLYLYKISNIYQTQDKPENPLKSREILKILLMKKLEKLKSVENLEQFQLGNEKMTHVFGGATTGAGEYEMKDYPSPGYNTCISYTSDMWDGQDSRTMLRFGEKANAYLAPTTNLN